MGKTILELFQTKPLTQGPFVGQTAEVGYAVRDFKKENPLSGPSILLNSTGFALANIARKNLSIKNKESFFEQETTGIRIIRLGAIPIIYGTDLLRITQRTTNVLDVMKSASNGGEAGNAGLVGNALNKAKAGASKFASKLGIAFPETMIPSRIILNDKFLAGLESDTPTTLTEIKKDAAGNLVGKFLAKNVSGTPTQIGNAVVGGAINGAKSAVRKKLFGSRTEAGQNLAKKKEGGTDYNSETKYSKVVDETNEEISSRFDLSSTKTALELLYKVPYPYGFKNTDTTPTFPLELNEPYTETKNLGESDPIDRNDLSAELFARKSNYERERFPTSQIPTFPNSKNKNRFNYDETNSSPSGSYRNSKNLGESDPIDRNDLSAELIARKSNYERETLPTSQIPTFPTRKTQNKYFYDSNNQERYAYKGISNFSNDNIRDIQLSAVRGINNGADTINAYGAEENDPQNKIDFVTLKFDNTQFRATITGLSETFSPSWDSNKFIGSPFNYYTYSGIERSVSFNFKVFSLNIEEHNNAWNKLQSLAKKTYPIGYAAFGVVAPIIDFTMTDLYNRKKSFIESLSFTIDDNSTWEVFVEGLRLPHIIDVAITLKFIEQRNDETKLYDFDNVNISKAKRAPTTPTQNISNKPIVN